MSVYKVDLASACVPVINGVVGQIVVGNSTAEAKALSKGLNTDDQDAAWGAATVTDLGTAIPLTGWVFAIAINTVAPISVSVTGDADDTLDDVMAKMVIALNATSIDNSAYNSGTNVLTVASIADGIGNKTVTVTVTPPTGLFPTTYTWDQTDVVVSKVDGGIAGAVLTVTFSTSWVVPGRLSTIKE